jgi:hypothetical protein
VRRGSIEHNVDRQSLETGDREPRNCSDDRSGNYEVTRSQQQRAQLLAAAHNPNTITRATSITLRCVPRQ